MRKGILLGAMLAGLFAAAPAHALDESTRRPFYVQGTIGSFGIWGWSTAPGPGVVGYWHPDFDFGYHFSGRHDGVEIGIHQGFYTPHRFYDVGETAIRGGYDVAFPFRNGRFELTIAPFATFGLDYIFTNLQAGVRWSVGIEAKLFFFHELYLLVRPVELSMGEFVNVQPNVYFNMNAGIGAGVSF